MTQWCQNAHNSKNLINLSRNNNQVIFLPNSEKCCELLLLKWLEDAFKVLFIFRAFLQLHPFWFWIPINWIIKVIQRKYCLIKCHFLEQLLFYIYQKVLLFHEWLKAKFWIKLMDKSHRFYDATSIGFSFELNPKTWRRKCSNSKCLWLNSYGSVYDIRSTATCFPVCDMVTWQKIYPARAGVFFLFLSTYMVGSKWNKIKRQYLFKVI